MMDKFDNTLFDNIKENIKRSSLKIYGDTKSQTYDVSYNITNIPIDNKDVPCNSGLSKFKTTIESGLLPPMVKWVSLKKDVIVFEKRPEIKKISIIPETKSIVEEMTQEAIDFKSFVVELFIPWQVYVVILNENKTPAVVGAFLRPTPLKSLLEPVYCFPLPNIYADGRICTPVVSSIAEIESQNIGQVVQNAYQMFWSSSFNYDLIVSCSRAAKNGFIENGFNPSLYHGSSSETNAFLKAWQDNIISIGDINWIPVSEDDLSQQIDCGESSYNLLAVINRFYNNYIGFNSNSFAFVNNLYNNFATS